MTMSISEANAVNTVARYVLGIPNHAGPISDERVGEALDLLTAKAYKVLSAGLRAEEVREAFAKRRKAVAP